MFWGGGGRGEWYILNDILGVTASILIASLSGNLPDYLCCMYGYTCVYMHVHVSTYHIVVLCMCMLINYVTP